MSRYSLSLETSALSDPFDGSLFLTLVNTSPDNAQESNEVGYRWHNAKSKGCCLKAIPSALVGQYTNLDNAQDSHEVAGCFTG